MVVISAGQFLMGSQANDIRSEDDEQPQHNVAVSHAFAIGQFEVTRAQFEAFVAATGYETRANCRDIKSIRRQNWIGGTLGSSKRDLILSFA